jgi:hypothetical protein
VQVIARARIAMQQRVSLVGARRAQRPSRSTASASPTLDTDLTEAARGILKRLESGH